MKYAQIKRIIPHFSGGYVYGDNLTLDADDTSRLYQRSLDTAANAQGLNRSMDLDTNGQDIPATPDLTGGQPQVAPTLLTPQQVNQVNNFLEDDAFYHCVVSRLQGGAVEHADFYLPPQVYDFVSQVSVSPAELMWVCREVGVEWDRHLEFIQNYMSHRYSTLLKVGPYRERQITNLAAFSMNMFLKKLGLNPNFVKLYQNKKRSKSF